MDELIAEEGRGQLRYEEVAARLNHLIASGTYGPGARLPSVRRLSAQMGVSVTTVLEAYRRLEDAGAVEARPQSGYYVRERMADFPRGLRLPAEPVIPQTLEQPSTVSVGDFVLRMMQNVQNPRLISLGTAHPNPDLLPITRLTRAMGEVVRRDPRLANSYDVVPGCEALRVQIARRLVLAGCAVTPDEIFTTAGGLEAIHLALRVLCKPGDAVAVESPAYYGFLQLIESLDLRVLEIPSNPRDGISLDALEYALDHNRVGACLVITHFSNPLGGTLPDVSKQRLVEMLASRGIPLIEDDVYGELYYGDVRPRAAKSWDTGGNVLLCGSFSKTLAPGYRVGWMAGGRYHQQVMRRKLVTNLGTAMITQLALAEFLTDGGFEHILRRARKTYREQTLLMGQALAHYFPEGTKASRPSGGFVLWVELPAGVDGRLLYERALDHGIGIAPGAIFSAQGKYRNCIRLNAARWNVDVERAIERIGKIAAELQTTTS
jgi:DNA-binding transcriptional MocR family regulator